MASLKVTYILWLFFGWLGLHHLYLGRVNHAIVWFTTFGGGFGIGWLRDLWRIPQYVEWATGSGSYQKKHLQRIAHNITPSCSMFRLAGIFTMGLVGGAVLSGVVPEYTSQDATKYPVYYFICRACSKFLYILGGVLGVYLVANIGELQTPLKTPFLGCIFSLPWVISEGGSVSLAPIFAGLSTWLKGLSWRQLQPGTVNGVKRKTEHCYNICVYCVACGMWMSLLGYGLYFNAHIIIEGDEKIPLREAISNFFKSPAWIRTMDSLRKLFFVYRHAGWSKMYSDAKEFFDFSGESNAYSVLGIDKWTSQKEITKRCRTLSREYHPDRFKVEKDKEYAQTKFIEIQEACNTLSTVKARRAKFSSRSETAGRETNPFKTNRFEKDRDL